MLPRFLIIHHSATSRDHTTFQGVKNYHIRKGWGNIGYHFFITSDGILHEGRGQDQVGAHCRANGMNFKSLGICLAGNFEVEQPTTKQLDTLRGIIGQLRKIWNIPADKVLGHKEVEGAKTACPGKYLSIFVKTIRKVNSAPSPESTDELLSIVKEQRQEIGQLKEKNKKCQHKLQIKQKFINELKVALESKKNWLDKLIELIKKNE